MAKLGYGENHAFIYDRRGEVQLAELTSATITWPRLLNSIGRATIDVPAADCAKITSKLATWAQTLVVYRDQKRVWEGPIRKLIDGPGKLTVEASDVVGWTERRVIRSPRRLSDSRVLTELNWSTLSAFAVDDPNIVRFVQQLGSTVDLGAVVDRDLARYSDYHATDLGNLVGLGGRYTALGRSIMLWSSTYTIGTTPRLVPERHLLADVTITEDGDSLGTAVYARDDNGTVGIAAGPGTGPDPVLGEVEILASVTGTQRPGYLTAIARATRATAYPAPIIINVPDDAQLRPDSPFTIDQLVPGMLVPLQTQTATGRTISATFVLTGVKVVQEPQQDEKVTITLGSLIDTGS